MINYDNNPEILNKFLIYTETILNKSPNTVKEYNYDLNTFLKFLKMHFRLTKEFEPKNISINDITLDELKKVVLDDLHAYLGYLNTDLKNNATTRARKVASVKSFFNYLIKMELLPYNPAQNLETPKLEKRIPKYLTLEESKKLLNVTLTPTSDEKKNRNIARDYAMVTIFLNCGIRLSELIGINIKDINFEDEKMTVIGKGDKERVVFLNKSCIKAIKEYLIIRNRKNC